MYIRNCHRLLTAEKQDEDKPRHASIVLQHIYGKARCVVPKTTFKKQGLSSETNRKSATQNIPPFYASRYFTTADKTAHY
jgi:hypothetical protein